MTDVLERILARKRAEIAAARAAPAGGAGLPAGWAVATAATVAVPGAAISAAPGAAGAAESAAPLPDGRFLAALRRGIATRGLALIAEIKRRSPSHGLIRADFDAAAIARAYAAGGATCLSVLTDGPDFGGSLADLSAARAASGLPVLRKDFIIDAWQLAEARAAGADCVLIIVAALGAARASALIRAAVCDFGLEVLVEVASAAELDAALASDAVMIGINTRDLRSLEMDPDRALRLAPRVPPDRLAIALSGLRTHAELLRHAEAGVRAFLVGEALMRAPDITAATRRLLGDHG